MTAHAPRFDDRAHDEDFARWVTAAEHYIDVVRGAVRTHLAAHADPPQAMLEAFGMLEAWLSAAGEPGFEAPDRLVGQLDTLLDTLQAKLPPAATLRWLRTRSDILDGKTPIEAVVRHRIKAVLALAASLPDPPTKSEPRPPGPEAADGR